MRRSAILDFYRHDAPDDRGRTLDEVRAQNAIELERVHDYIQWLFPLPEPSGANPAAPILTADDIAAFHADESLRRDLLASFAVMLEFYGFRVAHGTTRIERLIDADIRIAEWFRPGNHNFLRLTRIMRSLAVLGLPEYAHALLAQLEQLYREQPAVVGEQTMGFWRRAGR